MRLSFAFRLVSSLMALAGFLSLMLTGNLPPLMVIPALMAFVINGIQLFFGGKPLFSKQTWYGMTLLVFILFVVDTLWISQSILQSTIHFLIFLMINKLFNLATAKDYLQLYLISFLQLLAASGLSPGFSYAISFMVYMILAVWTLILYHLQREVEDRGLHLGSGSIEGSLGTKPEDQEIETVINFPFFAATNIIAITAFGLALFLFFLIPRIGTGLFQTGNSQTVKVSGFSDTVRLGTIGAIKLDPTVVMRVILEEKEDRGKGALYLRGTAFDYYDGKTWSKSPSPKKPLFKNKEGEFILTPFNEKGPRISHEIISEPLDTPIIFALSEAVSIQGSFTSLYTDAMGTISLPFTPYARFSYKAISILPVHSPKNALIKKPKAPINYQDHHLQLPGKTNDIGELARSATQDQADPYQKAMAIEEFLKSNYSYSLEIPSASDENPVEEFLFRRKTGYCEHYASAMVLMLRTIGIPARMVSGFLPTEWNNYGGYFTIRQRDAHTWVEALFPKYGWVTFDPTPAVGSSSGTSLFYELGQYMDTLQLKWDRYIIHYSFLDQTRLIKNMNKSAKQLHAKANHLFKNWLSLLPSFHTPWGQNGGSWAFFGYLGILLIPILLTIFYFKKRDTTQKGTEEKTIELERKRILVFYLKMLKIVGDQETSKEHHQTPNEYLKQIRHLESPYTRIATEMTESYNNIRFGYTSFSIETEKQMKKLIADLHTQVQQEQEKASKGIQIP